MVLFVVLCEMIKAGFQKLVQSSYITLVPKEKSPSEQSPSQVIATTSSVEASVPFLSASQLQGTYSLALLCRLDCEVMMWK